MTKLTLFFSFVTLLSINCLGQTIDTNYVDGKIYTRTTINSPVDLGNYNFSDPVLNAILTLYGVTDIRLPFGGLTTELDRTFEISFTDEANIDNLITDINNLAYIVYAEKIPLHRTSLIPNDVHVAQWGLTKVQAFDAWDLTTGNSDVRIAIVDNAVSTVHEDLINNIWINPNEIPGNSIDDDLNGFIDDVSGFDVADFDNNPNPPSSAGSSSIFVHGTHCAGIASASTNNGTGIAGLGYSTSIIPVKCSPDLSLGSQIPNAYDGVYYAIQSNADVISMSWGGSAYSTTGESLLTAANSLGIVLIAAAGNNNNSDLMYPAAFPYVISVGATDLTDSRSWFSNYGSTIDVMAPGSDIYSTLSGTGNEYGQLSGTSMACPLVAGLAGLVLAEYPSFSPQNVEDAIKLGCDDISAINPGFSGMLGAGRINAYNTLLLSSGIEPSDDINPLLEGPDDFHLFPNPHNHVFHIIKDTGTHIENINVHDLNGRNVKVEVLQELSSDLIIRLGAGNGLYLIEITTKDAKKTYRIQKMP